MKSNLKNALKEKIQISMLCELYGDLISVRQREYIDNYYNQDLSLSEIAENNNITRQAVRDNINKGKNKLIQYEEQLHLLDKRINLEKNIEELLNITNQISNTCTDTNTKKLIETMNYKLKNLNMK